MTANAVEKGHLSDKQEFLNSLRKLLASGELRYLQLVHRYLPKILSWPDISQKELFNFYSYLLDTTLQSYYPFLYFTAIFKLGQHDQNLLKNFMSSHGAKTSSKYDHGFQSNNFPE